MLNTQKAKESKESGMNQSVNNADLFSNGAWSKEAYDCLIEFASKRTEPFLAEEAREWAERFKMLAVPPSKRAWGGVIVRASRSGLIKHIGYAKTANVKAHRTPASLWEFNSKNY